MLFPKGHTPWNKGKTGVYSDETRNRISTTNKKKGLMPPQDIKMSQEKHGHWKGDAVGYFALHGWLKRLLGKPTKCQNLNCVYPRRNKANKILLQPKKFAWANISGEYKRDINDWQQLCYSCNGKDGIKINKRFKNETILGGGE